jgi:hypothetical protein
MCGMPYHRYGWGDREHDYDPTACINSLRGEIERITGSKASEDGALLRQALEITTGARSQAYGHAADNLGRTARLMQAYCEGMDREFTIGDVAAMMVLVKLARLHQSPDHYDSLLDIAGYVSAAWDGIQRSTDAPPTGARTAHAGSEETGKIENQDYSGRLRMFGRSREAG